MNMKKPCCQPNKGATRRRRRRADEASTLGGAARGSTVRVVSVNGGRRMVHRLAALGVVPGARVTVRRPRGPALVSLHGASVAIGTRAAACVEVEEVQE